MHYAAIFLYLENPAIVAGFYAGCADKQKANKKSAQNVLVSKAPLCKWSCREATEGLFENKL